MNKATQKIVDHILVRPAPPQKSATKKTFVRFALNYSEWLLTLDALAVNLAADSVGEGSGNGHPASGHTEGTTN